MRLITNRQEVLACLNQAVETAVPLFCPNAETPDEMEGLLTAAADFARETDQREVVIGIGITSSYPDHPQLGFLCPQDGPEEDFRPIADQWLGWLRNFSGNKHFERVGIIPFLDHGWEPHKVDRDLMCDRSFQEAMGIIMFDASASDMEANIDATAAFASSARDRVVVEGCPDKVYEHAEAEAKGLQERDLFSNPDAVARYVERTGVDLIVPNLGTEHRTTGSAPLEFQESLAREIRDRVGSIMALHGTSSLGGEISGIGMHGIVKINYYTAMARLASKRLRERWEKNIEPGEPLPISRACGSFVYRIRREAVREDCLEMLRTLYKSN